MLPAAARAPPGAARRLSAARTRGARVPPCRCAQPRPAGGATAQQPRPAAPQPQPPARVAPSQQERAATLAQPLPHELEAWAHDYAMPDEMSIWDDDGGHFSSRAELRTAYRPPRSDVPGVAAALSLIVCWGAMFQHAMWHYDLAAPLSLGHVLDGLFTFSSLEFLSTGLFITTHDSMHGSVAPNNRFLNDAIGAAAVSLYAWFDYQTMWSKHWAHHGACGTPHEDPDFHHGDPALLPWFLAFMRGYVSVPQLVKLQAVVLGLVAAGAGLPNLLLFWAGSGLLSAARLWYFGTFMPHKPRKGADEVMAWPKARSARAPAWLTFLQCFHFNAHFEHHRWPFAPWWDLPRARALRYETMGSLDD